MLGLPQPLKFLFPPPNMSAPNASIRLRHPKGVNTIDLDPNAPISALQQTIFSYTEIPPAQQECKSRVRRPLRFASSHVCYRYRSEARLPSSATGGCSRTSGLFVGYSARRSAPGFGCSRHQLALQPDKAHNGECERTRLRTEDPTSARASIPQPRSDPRGHARP